MNKQPSKQIRYLNRDFDTILQRLIDYTKYYYPNSFNDFSPASPAMIILELISYVGDVLNFYIDKQTKQSILYYATQKQSIYNIAQSLGYDIKTAVPASVPLTFQYVIPTSSTTPGQVDYDYAPILYPGTVVQASSIPNSHFTVLNTINFHEPDEILATERENQSFKILRKKEYGYSVEEKQYTIQLGDTVRDNLKITLPDKGVVKILSVKTISGDDIINDWYEVSNLANDTVISHDISYNNNTRVFNRIKTNKRFKKLVDTNDYTYLYFGAKQRSDKLEEELYKAFYEYDYDEIATPALLLLNNNYGEVPTNVTMVITYLLATNIKINANVIDTITHKQAFNNSDYNAEIYNILLEGMIAYNDSPSIGGQSAESLQNIRTNALAIANTQNRLVTQQDYFNAVKIMPTEYGSVAKTYARRNNANNNIELWVLSYDVDKKLSQTNYQIKQNLGQFLERYRMLGDRIVINNAYIINVKCEFKIAVDAQYAKREVLYNAITKVKQIMDIDNFEIGSPIDQNYIKNQLLSIEGVNNVVSIQFYNLKGGNYSSVQYDMSNAFDIDDGKYYTSFTPSIFELKYPETDIVGSTI